MQASDMGTPGVGPRRRDRSIDPRRRQVVVRFSEEEITAVRVRAELSGSAVGAWIGKVALDAATGGSRVAAELPDLVRLHADVVALNRTADDDHRGRFERLLVRLEAAIDGVVAEREAGRLW